MATDFHLSDWLDHYLRGLTFDTNQNLKTWLEKFLRDKNRYSWMRWHILFSGNIGESREQWREINNIKANCYNIKNEIFSS